MNRLTKHIEEWIEGKSYEDLVNELVDLKFTERILKRTNFGFKRFNNDYLIYQVVTKRSKKYLYYP